jgi:hypothetical protein
MKPRTSAFVIILLIGGLILAGTLHLGTVSAATSVSGIISSDASWTKTNSPYSLTGNVLVSNGVTLTIEAGATVNLNGYYIMVNGTLQARGTSIEKVTFNGAGNVIFAQSSTSWNEQTGSGSIIENANLDSSQIGMSFTSPKIAGSYINSISVAGSAIVTNNNIINGINVNTDSEAPVISDNTISGEFRVDGAGSTLIAYNTINNGITITAGAGAITISHNTISGEVHTSAFTLISQNTINGGVVISGSMSGGGSATVSDNTITGADVGINLEIGLTSSTGALILNNKITANDVGINLSPSMSMSFYGGRNNATIIGNTISGCKTAGILLESDQTQGGHTPLYNVARIEKNTISNNYYGIKNFGQASIEGNLITNNYYGILGGDIIRYNTIADNSYGILGWASTIIYNNIQNNSEYSLHLGSNGLGFFTTSDLNATYNWWGTTDNNAISQKIYDYNNDFTLGKVTFVPFLTEPNPQATPDTFVSTPVDVPSPSPSLSPSPSPSSTNSPTPSQVTLTPEQVTTIVGAVIVAIVVGAAAGLLIYLIKKK